MPTSTMRAVQRESLLSLKEFSTLSPQDRVLLSNTLAFFQEEARIKKGAEVLVFIPSHYTLKAIQQRMQA